MSLPQQYKFYIKQGDTAPPVSIQVIRQDNGLPLNLTSSTVKFSMRMTGANTNAVNSLDGVITDAVNGKVEYRWTNTDTSTVGNYRGEFIVTLADTRITKFPNDGFIEVKIVDSISV